MRDDAGEVADLDEWLKTNPPFKGTALQDAAKKTGFEPSFVMLVLFPQVVDFMATNLDWTTAVGQAFTADRAAVLREHPAAARRGQKAGTLKTTPQQERRDQDDASGQQVIVIEPANPQVVYVPQYNPQVVYTQRRPPPRWSIKEESNDERGRCGRADRLHGRHRDRRGDRQRLLLRAVRMARRAYMYNDAWDDYYDDREDAREDWQDHREDVREERGTTARTPGVEQRPGIEHASSSARIAQQTRQQTQSTDRRRRARPAAQAARGHADRHDSTSASSYEARGQNRDRSSTASRAERHQVGRVFRLLERQVGALGQRAWATAAAPSSGGGGGRRR